MPSQGNRRRPKQTAADLVQYAPAVPIDWVDNDPVNVQQALDIGALSRRQIRYVLSAGIVEGGVATDNGDGTIDVSEGSGYFRPTNDPLADPVFLEWATTTNLAVTDDETRYVGILYNNGSPIVEVHTLDDFDGQTGFMLAVLVSETDPPPTVIHVTTHEPHSGDIARHLSEFHHAVFHIMRASGLAVSELGTRNLKISAGVISVAEDLIDFPELDTSGAGRLDAYYGSFTKVTGLSQWPNEQYDLAGTLTNMTPNRYGNLFLYVEPDSEAAIIYGDDQYVTAAQAEAASPPSSVPPRIREHGVLIAQLVFQKSAGTLTSILSPFVTQFDAAGVTDHDDLANNGGIDSHAIIAVALANALKISMTFYIENPVAGKEYPIQIAPAAFTINKIRHTTGEAGGNCEFNVLERTLPDTSGTAVFASPVTATSSYGEETSFANAGIAAEAPIAIGIQGTITAEKLWVYILGTINA